MSGCSPANSDHSASRGSQRPDDVSDKSRPSSDSSESRPPASVRRSSCQSARNLMADNIQRAHEGRSSPAALKNSRGGSDAQHQLSPTRQAATEHHQSQLSPGRLVDKSIQQCQQSPLQHDNGKRKSAVISPDSNNSETSEADVNRPDNNANRHGKGKVVVKKQMKQVVGDLETVLGGLRTVMGDLKTLVSQIDMVTDKLDQDYPDGPDARRRLSASVLEAPSGERIKQKMTQSVSQSCELALPAIFKPIKISPYKLKPMANFANVKTRSSKEGDITAVNHTEQETPFTPVKMRPKTKDDSQCRKSLKPTQVQSSKRYSMPLTAQDYDILYNDSARDTKQRGSADLGPSMDAKAILDALPRREVLIPPSFFDDIDLDISTRVVRNKSRGYGQQSDTRKVSKSSEQSLLKSDCRLFCGTGFSDSSWYDTADRSSVISRESSNRTNVHERSNNQARAQEGCRDQSTVQGHSPTPSGSPDQEYCGVYERELDDLLEFEFDDHLDVFDTFNSRVFDNQPKFKRSSYPKKYDDNVNRVKRYPVENAPHDTSLDYSDDRLSESATETNSDVLNDNFLPRTVNPNYVNFSWRTVIEP